MTWFAANSDLSRFSTCLQDIIHFVNLNLRVFNAGDINVTPVPLACISRINGAISLDSLFSEVTSVPSTSIATRSYMRSLAEAGDHNGPPGGAPPPSPLQIPVSMGCSFPKHMRSHLP